MKKREGIEILFTEEQKKILERAFDGNDACKDGGAVIAQVYQDGMKVTVLKPDEAFRVFKALNQKSIPNKHGFARTLAERKGGA